MWLGSFPGLDWVGSLNDRAAGWTLNEVEGDGGVVGRFVSGTCRWTFRAWGGMSDLLIPYACLAGRLIGRGSLTGREIWYDTEHRTVYCNFPCLLYLFLLALLST